MRLSTGLRNHLLSGGSLRAALNAGVIRMYTGSAAASPDAAVPGTATMICEISVSSSGTGLTFEAAAAGGRLQKSASEVWSGASTADQQVSWFRFVPAADDGSLSDTALRLQGTVAQVGADLNMSNTLFTTGATQTVDYFSIFQPE